MKRCVVAWALGVLLGTCLSGAFVMAAQFYNDKGQPSAPRGSIQEFDYYRQRQQFLDLNSVRRSQEEQLRQDRLNPCRR